MHTLKRPLQSPKQKTRPRDPFTRALATRLKEARLKAKPKLSQDDVGRLFEPRISRAAVSQWEDSDKGTTPDLDKLLVLARAYGTTVDSLLGGGEPQAALAVSEGAGPYNGNHLPAEALDLARAWASLPAVKKRLYQDAIEWDSVIMEAFPAMKQALVVVNPNYHSMTERFSKDELIRQIQLNLPI